MQTGFAAGYRTFIVRASHGAPADSLAQAHEDPATERAEVAAHEIEEIQEAVEEHAGRTGIHKHPGA